MADPTAQDWHIIEVVFISENKQLKFPGDSRGTGWTCWQQVHRQHGAALINVE